MGLSVMIVDDSLFTRELLRKQITVAGAEVVVEALDGKEAVERYDQLKPDLVFMDFLMRRMNGIEALKAIIAKHKDAKIIIYTSVSQKIVRKEAMNSGAKAFVRKPFGENEILRLVREYTK